jgi:Ras family protein A
VDGKPGWASGDFLDPIDDLADFLKSSWPGREVRLPQEVSKKPSILARSPSGTPPRRFRLDTAAGGPAASLKDTTDFPPGHTSWLFTPEEVCLVSQNDRIRLKLVIVGDRACGKTCAVDTFSKGRFPDVSVPTVVHNSHADIEVDGHMVELSFWDTSGQDHDRLRQLSYPGCHVVVISYAIDSPDSLENVCSKWISEKDWFTWHVPPVLVGLKEDLRRDPNTIAHLARTRQAPVTYQQGLAAAKYIGAAAYVECSAKTGGGIRSTFEMATKVGLHARDWSRQNFPRRRVKSGCISC